MGNQCVKGMAIAGLLSLGLSGPVTAEPDGAKDHDLLSRFPRAEIDLYEQQEVPEYRLATGALEKVNGIVRPEDERSVAGRLTRLTYSIPPGHRSQEVFRYLKQQLAARNPEWLFECLGRECGSSSQWANQQFGISKLYGLDREQAYLAARIGEAYLALYSTQRGTKRVYLQLDVIEPQGGALADGWLDPLREGRPVVLSAAALEQSTERVAELAKVLATLASREIWLVGHWEGEGNTSELQQQSQSMAEKLKQQLQSAGVAAERLFTLGVGPLAPRGEGQPQRRIEVIVR